MLSIEEAARTTGPVSIGAVVQRLVGHLRCQGLGSAKQIGMAAGTNQDKRIVPAIPDKQPIGLQVAFPGGGPIA